MLDRLRELCAQFPLREKIVVVPSLAIGHQIGDALARSGTPWINLRFETTRTIADAVVGLDLAREGTSVVSRAQALALIERACDRVLDSDSYFASLRGSPGLHRAIQRSIDDLRLAGIRGSLPRSAFETPRKAHDLERVLAAYEEELSSRKLIDRFGVIARAIGKLTAQTPGQRAEGAVWVVSDDVELPHEETRLVALASKGAATVRLAGTSDPSASMPRLRALTVSSGVGEENEVRGALRAIVRDARRHDEAELIYTTAEPYLALIYELCSEYGVEATFAEGIAVSFTTPGEACLAFLRWCGEGWNAVDLERAARAGALKTGNDALAPSALARVLRAASIGWGIDRHRTQLEALVAARASKLAQVDLTTEQIAARERDAEQARQGLAWMEQVLTVVRGITNDTQANASRMAEAAKIFVQDFVNVRNERDAMAAAALVRMFDELAQLPDSSVTLAEGASRLREAVLAQYVAASNPRPGHLHVAPLRSAAWSGRPRMFLVGLGESRFPGAGLQDPIVLDAERTTLNETITPRQLPLLGEAPLRAGERLRRCLSRGANAEWTISFPSLSLRDGRESFPAGDLLEIVRVSREDAAITLDSVLEEAHVARFIDAETPLAASDWWLAQRFIAKREDYAEALLAESRWLAQGQEAAAARASDALTRFDGVVPVDPSLIDPRLTGKRLSASQVEKMAACPFGWFLRNVLHVTPPEDLIRDPERWLDAAALGSLLHEIFERTMKRICEAHETPLLATHLPLMTEIAESSMDEWRVEIPPPNEAAFRRQRDEVLATCETFLRVEEEACKDSEAMFFEVPFGFSDAAEHPAGMTEPLVLDLGAGRSVELRGRIDRVDRTPRGTWQVWDYKTGSLWNWGGNWTFARGTKVQHAIYARALAAALKARGIDSDPVIEASGYLFPTPRGGGERIPKSSPAGELESVLNRTFDVIAAGFFAHPEDAGECRFCDFQPVCNGAQFAADRARAKYAANHDSLLVQRLRSLHEVG